MSVNLKELAKLSDEVCTGNQKAFSTLHITLYSRMYSNYELHKKAKPAIAS